MRARSGFQVTRVVSVMETMLRPAICNPLIADILPGPIPLTVTFACLIPLSSTLLQNDIAVAWAAIFVPFLVFLNPSMPHDLIIWTKPFGVVSERIVLFFVTRMFTIGSSLNWTPSNNIVGVSSSGKRFILLQTERFLVVTIE